MLEVRVVDDLRSTIELSFHKESIKIIVEYDGDVIGDVFTGLDMLYFKDKQLLSVESLIGTILTTEESTASICGSLFSISLLYQLCEQSMSIMNVLGFLQVCRCFVASLHIHPTNTIRNPQVLQKIDAINNSTGNTEQPSSFIWCLLLLAEVLGMHAVFHECIKKLATILQLHISKQISSSSDTNSHQYHQHTVSTGSGANFNNSSNDGGRVKRAFNMSYLPRPVTNIPGINMDANSIDSLEKRLLTHLSQYTSLLNLSLLQAFKRKQIGMRNNRDYDGISSRSSSSSSNKTAIITPTSDIATTNSNDLITNNKSSNIANNITGSKSISDDYFQNIGVVDSGGTVSHTNTTVDNSDVSTINSSTKAVDKHRDLVVSPSKLSSSAAAVAANTMHHPRPSMNSYTNNADYHHDDDADEESLSEDKDYSNSSSDRNHDHLSNPSIATDVTDISDLSMTPIAHYMKRDKSYHSERKKVSSSTTDSTWIPHVIHTHAYHTAHGYSDDHHRYMSNKLQKGYTAHQNHNSHHHNSHHDYHSSRHYENSVDQNDRYHHLTHGSNNADEYGDDSDDDYDDHEYDDCDDHDVLWSRPKHSPTEPVPLHPKSVYNYQGHYRPSSNPSEWVDDDDDATIRGRRWSADNRVMDDDDDDDRSRDYPSHHQHTNDQPHKSLQQHNISNVHRDNSNHHYHHDNHNYHDSRTAATVRSISPHDRIRHHQSSSTASTSPQRRRSPGVVAFGSSTPRSLVDNDDHSHQFYSYSSRFPTTVSLKTNTAASQDYSNNDHHHHSSSSPYHRSTRSKTPPTSAHTPTSSSSSSSGRRDNRNSNNNITTTYPSSITTSPPQLPSQVMNHHHHHHPVLSPDDLKMSREIALLRLKEVKVKEEIDASRRQAEADMRENRLKALELKTAVLRMKASPSKTTSSNIATAMVISTTTGTTTTTNNNYNYNNRINNNNSNSPTNTAHDSIIITTDVLSDHHRVPSPNVDTNININDYSHRLAVKSPLRQPFSSHQGVDSLNRIHSNSDGHAPINSSSTDNIPNTNTATITRSAISTTSPMQPQPLSAEQARVRALHRIRETRRAMEQQRLKEENLKIAAKSKNRDKMMVGRSESTAAAAAVIPQPLKGNAAMNGHDHRMMPSIGTDHIYNNDNDDDDNESSRLDQALFGEVNSENNLDPLMMTSDRCSGKRDAKDSGSITTISHNDQHNRTIHQSIKLQKSKSGHTEGQSKLNLYHQHQSNYGGMQTSTFPPKNKWRDNNFDNIVNSGFYSMEALRAVGLGFSPTSIRDDERKNDRGIIGARGSDNDDYRSHPTDNDLTTTTTGIHPYDVFPPPPPPLSASMTDEDLSIAIAHRNERSDNSENNHHHPHHSTSSMDHHITPTLDRSLEFQLKEEQLSNNLHLASSTYPIITSSVYDDHSKISNYPHHHRHQQNNHNSIKSGNNTINSTTTTHSDSNMRKRRTMMDVISIKIIRASELMDCLGGTNAYIVLDWGKLGKASTQAVINSNEPYFGSTLKFRSPYQRIRRKDVNDDDYRDGNILDMLNSRSDHHHDVDDREDDECLISHAGPLKVLVYNRNHSVSDELIGSGEIDVHEQLLSLYNKIIINNNNNNNNNYNHGSVVIHDLTDAISTLYLLDPSGNYKTTRNSVGFIEYTIALH